MTNPTFIIIVRETRKQWSSSKERETHFIEQRRRGKWWLRWEWQWQVCVRDNGAKNARSMFGAVMSDWKSKGMCNKVSFGKRVQIVGEELLGNRCDLPCKEAGFLWKHQKGSFVPSPGFRLVIVREAGKLDLPTQSQFTELLEGWLRD